MSFKRNSLQMVLMSRTLLPMHVIVLMIDCTLRVSGRIYCILCVDDIVIFERTHDVHNTILGKLCVTRMIGAPTLQRQPS